jgi:hypothetical protein
MTPNGPAAGRRLSGGGLHLRASAYLTTIRLAGTPPYSSEVQQPWRAMTVLDCNLDTPSERA